MGKVKRKSDRTRQKEDRERKRQSDSNLKTPSQMTSGMKHVAQSATVHGDGKKDSNSSTSSSRCRSIPSGTKPVIPSTTVSGGDGKVQPSSSQLSKKQNPVVCVVPLECIMPVGIPGVPSLLDEYFKDQEEKRQAQSRKMGSAGQGEQRLRHAQHMRQKRMCSEYRIKERQRETASRRRMRAQPEVKRKEKERETAGRRETRLLPEVKGKEKERETAGRRETRLLPKVKGKEKERETAGRREIRLLPEVKEKERKTRREIRLLPEVKGKEKERETAGRREIRLLPEVKEKERKTRREIRLLPEVKGKEKERETAGRREIRLLPEVKEKERKTRREIRLLPEVKGKEKERETAGRREIRLLPEVKKKERKTRWEIRLLPEVKGKEKERETAGRRETRLLPKVKGKEKKRETAGRRKKRQNPDVRGHEAHLETPLRKKRRLEMTEAEKEVEREVARNRRSNKRRPPDDPETAVNVFKEEIRKGPTYICTCCFRLLYQTSVCLFKLTDFAPDRSALVNRNITGKHSFDGRQYMCSSCRTSLKKGDIPALSAANGLQLDDVPEQLQDLNELETVFISRRVPFMKLVALPRGKQKAVHGCVVNVPVEPEAAAASLPRVPSSDSVVLVRLKRKLAYRGHVLIQNIRPQKIKDSLHLLKFGLQNPLYEDVLLNEEWEQTSQEKDPGMWENLTGVNVTSGTESSTSQSEEHQSDSESEDQEDAEGDERSKLSGLPFDSCLMPKDLSTDKNFMMSIAPGEGKRPVAIESDEHSEELSFPQLFPSGRFGFSSPRPRKLTLKKYFQSRILHADGRFAKNIAYIFYAQYRCEAKDTWDSLSIALRKGTNDNITAGDVKENLMNFIRGDLGIHFLQKVRGSPAYFNKFFYDILGTIRQLGPCTWFVTLSAADLKWHDTIQVIAKQLGVTLSDDDIDKLSWEDRCAYIRSNPVTTARHFDHRVQQFLKLILLNESLNPLGKVTCYKYRIEFQHRGSPHVHMLVWIENAPSIEDDTAADVKAFIDRHITCELPEEETLRTLLLTVQKHSHSVACKKHGVACRFHFPRPPVPETLIVKPPSEQPSSDCQTKYKEILGAVHEQLKTADPDCDLSIQTILQQAGVSEEDYLAVVSWMKTSNGQPAILLKRAVSEVNINNYNATMMNAWEANLDVQFVVIVYACVMYVASYVSKPEKTLGDLLKGVSASSQHLGPKTSMKAAAKKFLTHREVSAQEGVYRILPLPLTQGSRQVLFLPTDLLENRTRLFKPMAQIQRLEDDDPDVFQTGILERYPARPENLEDMCFAYFASRYRYVSTKPKLTDDTRNTTECDEDGAADKFIKLRHDLGYMCLRPAPAIIRSHQWSVRKQPEQFFHAQLLLYAPWRNEIQDLKGETYEDMYKEKLEIISTNRRLFEHHAEAVDQAIRDLEEFGVSEDSWETLAPQTEQQRSEEAEEGFQPENSAIAAFEPTQPVAITPGSESCRFIYEAATNVLTTAEWHNLVMSLNTLQCQVHQYVLSWCINMILYPNVPRPEPFCLFLTGGAGVGKSHLVKAIVQTVTRVFARHNSEDDSHVLVCAPTGAAAYNVSGLTLHSAFLLPVHSRPSDDYIPLTGEKLANLKVAIGNIKLLVIDEISMVGADMLLTVHRRLCDIMSNDEPFGGVAVLAVGDLLQLPPVAQKNVFEAPADEMAALYGSLWQNHFQLVELTQIQRQKGDEGFAALLNRVRVGQQTDDDLLMLQTRIISPPAPLYPEDATHIFAFNKQVNEHNQVKLQKLPEPHFTFKAVDSKKDTQTNTITTASFSDMSGGLPSSITLAVDARVMLTKNLDVRDGLVNTAFGRVTGFLPQPQPGQDVDTFKPKYVLVLFDDDNIGKRCREASRGILPDRVSTPIAAAETPIQFSRYSKVTAKRLQFPLVLAWGVTIHKEQGKTEDQLVLATSGSFKAGQFYTAISRTKELQGLHIIGEVQAAKIKVNQKALNEIKRMKKHAMFKPPVPEVLLCQRETYLRLFSFNVNSLHAHEELLRKDQYIQRSDITCLTETWLKPTDETPEYTSHNSFRLDNDSSFGRSRSGGLLTYIGHEFFIIKQHCCPGVGTEHQFLIISPKPADHVRIGVLTLYNNPKTTVTSFLPELDRILSTIPQGIPVIVCGDFNINALKSSTASKQLQQLMMHYGFQLCISTPTHKSGGCIDHIYLNFDAPEAAIHTIPVFYSDHLIVAAALPISSFMY